MCKTPHSSSGYTLIEMVVVLSILSLMAAICQPRVSRAMNRYRAELGARQILADLSLARAQAKSSSKSQTVSFNIAASSYTLSGIQSLDNRSANYVVELSSDPFGCTLVSATFNGTSQVTFDAYGSADNGGKVVVQCGEFQNSVTLEPTNGKATVQ